MASMYPGRRGIRAGRDHRRFAKGPGERKMFRDQGSFPMVKWAVVLGAAAWTGVGHAGTHVAAPGGPGLRSVIAVAADGDTVLLLPGTHRGEGNRDLQLEGKSLVILGQGAPESIVIDCEGQGRAFLLDRNDGPSTILEGFTIRGGRAPQGGGIRCDGAAPRLVQIRLVDNEATVAGGGIYCDGGAPQISESKISWNRAPSGGGLFCDNATPALSGTAVTGNLAVYGGGFYCSGSNGSITTSEINANLAWAGGAMCLSESSPRITRCQISENEAQTGGGGIRCVQLSSPEIQNSYLLNNRSGWNGGAIHCRNRSSPRIVHCTFAGNFAVNEGAGIFSISKSCEPVILYSILAGSPPQAVSGNGRARVSASAWPVSDGTPTNIDSRTIQALRSDHRLDMGSPAVDAGGPEAYLEVDFDGDRRPWGSGVDLGADEWVPKEEER